MFRLDRLLHSPSQVAVGPSAGIIHGFQLAGVKVYMTVLSIHRLGNAYSCSGFWISCSALWVHSEIPTIFQTHCQLVAQPIPDSKVHGANMGPTCVLSAPDGPHVGLMNFAIKDDTRQIASYQCCAMRLWKSLRIPTKLLHCLLHI